MAGSGKLDARLSGDALPDVWPGVALETWELKTVEHS